VIVARRPDDYGAAPSGRPIVGAAQRSQPSIMLEAIRRHATSWVVKAFLVVLVLSFAVWGIGDVFRTTRVEGAVASVGGVEIGERELQQELDAQLRRLREQLGTPIDRAQAIQLGLLNQALQSTIARRLVDTHARALGLTMADATIAQAIRDDPLFAGSAGFDRQRFEQILRMQGMSEAEFVAAMREDGVRRTLLGVIAGAASGPRTSAERIWAYRNEKRTGRALVVDASRIEGIETPDETTLATWLEAHADRFQAPEMRRFLLVELRPADVAKEVTVDEARLREEYEHRLAEYRTPETRDLEQLLAGDEAAIRDAKARATAGESFSEIATALSAAGVRREALTGVAQGTLPAAFEEPIKQLAVGEVSEPVKSDFGWHLFRLSAVHPASVEPFEQHRDALARELALAAAQDQIPDLANAFEDQIAGGASLEDAGKAVGARVLAVGPVDRSGNGADGKPPAGVELAPPVLADAFAKPVGEVGAPKDLPDGGLFVLRVDAVEPARPRRLEEVRAAVEQAWRAEQQGERARSLATALRDRAAAGEALDALAATDPALAVRELGPTDRATPDPVLGPGVVAALFATAPEQIAAEIVPLPTGAAVVQTLAVEPAPPASDLDPLIAELARGMRGDLLQQYEGALRNRFPIEVNQAALARLMSSEPAG
jgi:peptidyl-prolyl cis-trans isomerase D